MVPLRLGAVNARKLIQLRLTNDSLNTGGSTDKKGPAWVKCSATFWLFIKAKSSR